MHKFEELSYCGIYCRGCKNFKENLNCQGCRFEQNLVDDCPSRLCTISRKLTHCGECDEFPCEMLKEFYEDGVPHHNLAYKNILRINNIGIEKWLEEQETINTCDCGNRKLWFAKKCENHSK